MTSSQIGSLAQLQVSNGHLTLLFANTFNILYQNKSLDPIFGAADETPCSLNNGTCYTSFRLQAALLGCVEAAEVCSPKSGCIDIWAPGGLKKIMNSSPAEDPLAGEMSLVAFALNSTDFASTISTRHGLILDATNRIIGSKSSLPLLQDQWKLEAERLFGISILRAKMELFYAVLGTRVGKAGFTDITTQPFAEACKSVQFQAVGWVNLSWVGLWVLTVVPLALAIVAGAAELWVR